MDSPFFVEEPVPAATWWMMSATGMPSSACFKTATIYSTENRFFTANSPGLLDPSLPKTHPRGGPKFLERALLGPAAAPVSTSPAHHPGAALGRGHQRNGLLEGVRKRLTGTAPRGKVLKGSPLTGPQT